jgi:hypothetical protein
MHDAARVRGRDAIGNREHDLQRLSRRERRAVEARAQRFSLQQFRDGVMDAVLAAEIEDGQDVRMRQRRDRTRLAIKTIERNLVLLEMRRQHLDRNIAMQPRILGAINLTHPTDRDQVEDRVTPESCAGVEQR